MSNDTNCHNWIYRNNDFFHQLKVNNIINVQTNTLFIDWFVDYPNITNEYELLKKNNSLALDVQAKSVIIETFQCSPFRLYKSARQLFLNQSLKYIVKIVCNEWAGKLVWKLLLSCTFCFLVHYLFVNGLMINVMLMNRVPLFIFCAR